MAAWTTGQDRLLFDEGHKGVVEVQRQLESKFGVKRTQQAIQRRASRIGASLSKYEICPSCGMRIDHLVRGTGLCPVCSERYHIEEHRRYSAYLTSQVKKSEEYRRAKREHNTIRRENERIAQRYNLPSKREYDRLAEKSQKNVKC